MAFAFGELAAEQAEAFRAHLAGCPTCQAVLADFERAAELVRRVRTAESLPAPAFRPLALPAEPRRAGRWFWAGGAVGALAATAAALLVWPDTGPMRSPEGAPTHLAPRDAPPPSSAEPAAPARPVLGLHVAGREGALLRDSPGQGAARPIPPGSPLRAGDELWTGPEARAVLELGDRSRLALARSSRLRLEAAADTGDRFSLVAGALAVQVSPRAAERPFLVMTPQAELVVRGTRFAVRIEGPGGLWVGVEKGAVELRPRAAGVGPVLLEAGRAARLRGGPAEVGRLDPAGRAELQALLAAMPAPGTEGGPPSAGRTRFSPPSPPPAPPPRPPEPAPWPAPAGRPGEPPGGDSLRSLVEALYRDTAWIFDDLRADMEQGHYERVLRRIELYLADPDSPDRAEAVFLRAVCLESLGRPGEARAVYQEYTVRWPTGRRAAEAIRGYLRSSRKAR
jgi:ferric-dicitrate binding protein FerR (iron transport regulator)